MSPRPSVIDQADRDAAIKERARNVLIDAGAGTGKTSTLVERLIALVAPHEDHVAPMRMERIAAVTFTRRAAGELRLRLRERLLVELGKPKVSRPRANRLRNALSHLDVAHVGTIHAFADRLLRLHPVQAALSPSYTIAEDDDALVRETFELLMTSAESGTLASELAGSSASDRAKEAEGTVLDAIRAGLRPESHESEFMTRYGLDAVVGSFVRQRDVTPRDPPLRSFDRAAFERASTEFRALAARVNGSSTGARWVTNLRELLGRLMPISDPVVLYAELYPALHSLKTPTFGEVFENDQDAWHVWKLLTTGANKKVTRPSPLRDELLAPLARWLATRLVRLFPVVVALYEKVKAKHQAVDSVDLLIKLRDLLARNLDVRGRYQVLFDHVFVDEFQDTDPLQAEIILYLCEKTPIATTAADVELADGKLTLVGDPKQSIYRFRRADIAMYQSVRSKVASRPHRAVQLSANFRSTPPLIDWFNERFEALLGAPPKPGEAAFSPETGGVAYQKLQYGRRDGQSVSIHVVSFEPNTETPSAADYRALEAEVLARYLRWLIASGFEVLDPVSRERRAVTYADVAILALETTNLKILFPELDAVGVPHAARGGKLFLQDPLHRQFLLGLRAISDREDGVAQAALFRPPFFALEVADLVSNTPAAAGAKEIVTELRAKRLGRPAGETARDLLERTAFGRSIALGPNGLQRLERVRELCFIVDEMAARDALDYDGVTARLRGWATDPVELDAPHPLGADAVQILTVHQAKGLEFPVVVLWDGRAGLGARADHGPWHVTRDGNAWQLTIDRLSWEEPAGAALKETEKRYCDAERKRLVYVAATRARDLVVVPKAGAPGDKHVAGMLLAGGHGPLSLELQPYRSGKLPTWARTIAAPAARSLAPQDVDNNASADRWAAALASSAKPRCRPVGVASATHLVHTGESDPAGQPSYRPSRFGTVFGDTVHRALGEALRRELSPVEAVHRAAARTGLVEHVDEAVRDVERGLRCLEDHGLTLEGTDALRLEYPIVGQALTGNMLVGYIDLLVSTKDGLRLIDFKTDRSDAATPLREGFPSYVKQVETYVALLHEAGVSGEREVKAGLLFTDEGSLRWL
ncbi:MAG: UvrD-helicase domain-containing protein [Polyangiaceae bacterium]|nr:UvrD-helicase domain-containing protein [Polyangiaceae bacterium]